MSLNLQQRPDEGRESDALSDKAREALRILKDFRVASNTDAPVFRSVRSRPVTSRIVVE